VLSKGHGVMAQYACLHELGWLDDRDLDHYIADGTRLKGLADADVPGVEVSSGSLGHGLSVGVGLALPARRKGTARRVYAIVGDGEANEGPIWEARLFAPHFKLRNLITIIDANGFQAMGATRDVMDLGRIADRRRPDGQGGRGHAPLAGGGDLLPLCGQFAYVASSRLPRRTEGVVQRGRHITSYNDRRSSIRPLSSRQGFCGSCPFTSQLARALAFISRSTSA
jgi:hypothetical protein